MGVCLSSLRAQWLRLGGPAEWESFPLEETSELTPRLPPPRDLQWSSLAAFNLKGEGATCEVHTAWLEGVRVAVKLLKKEQMANEQARKDLISEISILRKLHHPNVVRMVGSGETEEQIFLVLEVLVSTLGDEWRENSFTCWRWPIRRVLHCAIQIARAMRYLHEEAVEGGRLLHRDLKPDNIGLGRGGRVVLLDFGVAKVVRGQDYEPHAMTEKTGSIRYMSPEVRIFCPLLVFLALLTSSTLSCPVMPSLVPFLSSPSPFCSLSSPLLTSYSL